VVSSVVSIFKSPAPFGQALAMKVTD
jgi:hypothetical protein